MKKALFITLLSIPLLAIQLKAQDKATYSITGTYSLEGDGSWDYITKDAHKNRLFVSHATMVQVVSTEDGSLLGNIENTKGVHGIALAYDLNKGFTSNGKDSSVTIFNLDDLKTIKKLKIPAAGPDAILYDSFSQRVFTFNGKSNDITAIDAKTHKILGSIALECGPEFAVTDGKGYIYVNLEDKSKVLKINPVTLKIENTWALGKGEEPSGLAIDVLNMRLFSVCHNRLMVVLNANTGKVLQELPIGSRVDAAAYDPGTKMVFSSNGEGTLTVIKQEDADHYSVVENARTQMGARTMALDLNTHNIYLPTAKFSPTRPAGKSKETEKPKIIPNTFSILVMKPQM